MYRIFVTLTIFICLLIENTAFSEGMKFRGRAAVLIDGLTGQVLYDKNGNEKNFPASTTKLLTALVAVERGDLNQIIRVSSTAAIQIPDSSSCYLSAGEEHRLEYLLYGLLLSSGNDCAIAIAEGLSEGNMQQFVIWMNETARRTGATHSNFTNPHGLHDPNHFTTALDLARIAQASLSHPIVQKISGTREFIWPGRTNGTYYNHNALLFTYEGTIGGKTGYTEEAKLTLVSAAKRQGRQILGVVMGEDSRTTQYEDMVALLDYGFEQFESTLILSANSPFGNITVAGGSKKVVPVVTRDDVLLTIPKDADPEFSITRIPYTDVKAPINPGQKLGVLEIREGTHVVMTVPLVAQESVSMSPPIMQQLVNRIQQGAVWVAGIFGGAFLLRIVVRTTRKIARRRRIASQKGRRRISRKREKTVRSV